jgi:23S rRNA pseudouridine2605 synthase
MIKEIKDQRLQKVLAQRGFGSRREIEGWIVAGKVLVNGKVAELGCKVGESDVLTVNGRVLSNLKKPILAQQRLILYHKPVGEICTRNDPEGRPTVFGSLPKLSGQRWVTVGRLDINSSGLLLMTTDGELANKLMHPSANLEREYAVRVLGQVTEEILSNLNTGVILDDGSEAKFNSVKFVGGSGVNSWYNVILKEGRYREVRRIWETQGIKVNRLIRIRYGSFKLPKDLEAGKYLELDYDDASSQFN